MIRIRDEDGHVVAAGGLGKVVEYSATHPVERVDLWPCGEGQQATVGVVWADRCLCIFDLPDERTARDWLAGQPALRDLVRDHGAKVST